MSLTTKKKVAFSFLNEKSYNKTVIYFNFGSHKDLSTLKKDVHLGLEALVNYHFFEMINPYVYLIEVNNFILFIKLHIQAYLQALQMVLTLLLLLQIGFIVVYLRLPLSSCR